MNLNRIVVLVAFIFAIHSSACSQESPRFLISTDYGDLIANVDNRFRIVAQQNEPVSIGQLNATFQTGDNEKVAIKIKEGEGYFIVTPDSTGTVEINVTLKNITETISIKVTPIPAVGRLGRFKANTDSKISVAEFKAQGGIIASVECCGFDASCTVVGYEVIRVSFDSKAEKKINIGGRFENDTEKLIQKASSGDIYVFKNIRYRSPGVEKPQRLEDMVFGIE